jgi:hypothetical protein
MSRTHAPEGVIPLSLYGGSIQVQQGGELLRLKE